MPRHKKKKRAAATSTIAKRTDWLAGDLVVAKLRGHRPWPAQIQKPEDYGYETRPHRIFVTFFGTDETCFCSYSKITPFTSSVRKSLAEQLQKINTNPELERAIKEIFAADDELKLSTKVHGGHHKDDVEAPPSPEERAGKRARVVEGPIADVIRVETRPSKQEKTVRSMAVEQVQKLPRKVRIKVSTQSSDSSKQPKGAVGEGTLQSSENASAVTSAGASVDVSPPRTGESASVAKDKSAGAAERQTDGPSVVPKDNVDGQGTGIVRHVSENGQDTAEKMDVDEGSAEKETVAAKVVDDGPEKMEVDVDSSQKETMKAGIGEEEKTDVGDQIDVGSGTVEKTDGPKNGVGVPDDGPTGKGEERKCETTVGKGYDTPAADNLESILEEKKQASPDSTKSEAISSTDIERASESGLGSGRESSVDPASVPPKVPDVTVESDPSAPEEPHKVEAAKEESSGVQEKEEEAASRSGPKNDDPKEQVPVSTTSTEDKTVVSVAAAKDDAAPSSPKEKLSPVAQRDAVTAFTTEKSSACTTQEETAHAPVDEKPSAPTVSVEKGHAGTVQVETVAAESTARVEAAPTLVNDQVSVSTVQEKALPVSIEDDGSASTAKEDSVPPVKEKASSSAEGNESERTSTAPSNTKEHVSVSAVQGETPPTSFKDQVSVSKPGDEKEPSASEDQAYMSAADGKTPPESDTQGSK